MDDLKGLKFRGMGRPADTIKAVGAVPVALEMGDVYDAAQRGLLDGMFEAMESWKGFRLGDVIKYGCPHPTCNRLDVYVLRRHEQGEVGCTA